MAGEKRWPVLKSHLEVGPRGAFFALLFGQAKSNLKIPLNTTFVHVLLGARVLSGNGI